MNIYENNSKLGSHLHKMSIKASESPLQSKLGACFIYCNKIVGDIHYNDYGTDCKAMKCTSVHAEKNAIIKNPFGIQVNKLNSGQWCYLKGKERNFCQI
jgi:hypothetical protein